MTTVLKDFLSPSQTARRLGVSDSAVRWMIQHNRLRVVRTPLGSLVHIDEVDRLAQERAAKGARGGREKRERAVSAPSR